MSGCKIAFPKLRKFLREKPVLDYSLNPQVYNKIVLQCRSLLVKFLDIFKTSIL